MGLTIRNKSTRGETTDRGTVGTPLPSAKELVKIPKALAKRTLRAKRLIDKGTSKMVRTATEKKLTRSREFIEKLRLNAEKSDEQLLKELAPYLNVGTKENPRAKDRPEVVDEKAMLAYRLKQRGLTFSQIAEQMKSTVPAVSQYYYKAVDHLTVEPTSISIPQNVGRSLNLFEEVQQMALMTASTKDVAQGVKMNALRVALDAEREKNAFLTLIGVYSAPVMNHFQQLMINQFSAPSTDAKNEGMNKFLSGLASAFSQHSTDQQLQLIAREGQAPSQSDVFGDGGEVIDV